MHGVARYRSRSITPGGGPLPLRSLGGPSPQQKRCRRVAGPTPGAGPTAGRRPVVDRGPPGRHTAHPHAAHCPVCSAVHCGPTGWPCRWCGPPGCVGGGSRRSLASAAAECGAHTGRARGGRAARHSRRPADHSGAADRDAGAGPEMVDAGPLPVVQPAGARGGRTAATCGSARARSPRTRRGRPATGRRCPAPPPPPAPAPARRDRGCPPSAAATRVPASLPPSASATVTRPPPPAPGCCPAAGCGHDRTRPRPEP